MHGGFALVPHPLCAFVCCTWCCTWVGVYAVRRSNLDGFLSRLLRCVRVAVANFDPYTRSDDELQVRSIFTGGVLWCMCMLCTLAVCSNCHVLFVFLVVMHAIACAYANGLTFRCTAPLSSLWGEVGITWVISPRQARPLPSGRAVCWCLHVACGTA